VYSSSSAVTIATRIIVARGSFLASFSSGPRAVALASCWCWALLTPLVASSPDLSVCGVWCADRHAKEPSCGGWFRGVDWIPPPSLLEYTAPVSSVAGDLIRFRDVW
jgi:hypothetical protein